MYAKFAPPPHLIHKQAFTLIELSIVLVIIGLVIGGVLFGKDLIAASEARAQISQIREFNLAVRTFQNKYNCLPGDCLKGEDFGLSERAPTGLYNIALGDGNGLIESNGVNTIGGGAQGGGALLGEQAMFWSDLTLAGLIASSHADIGYFEAPDADPKNLLSGASNPFNTYLPKGKIGGSNYISVWSGGWGADAFGGSTGTGRIEYSMNGFTSGPIEGNGIHYFALTDIDVISTGAFLTRSGMRVLQAYAIDSKIDDGLPQTGKITTMVPNSSIFYSGIGGFVHYASGGNPPLNSAAVDNYTVVGAADTAATLPTEHTCFDNNNVDGEVQRYSMSTNQGNGVNCALSFQFE